MQMVSSYGYGMSDAIGPVYLKERPGSEMPARIDVEVVKPLKDAYARMKFVLKKVFELYMTLNHGSTLLHGI
ncbi:putative peptidase M41 [Helianthus annuus]|uniref:Peptidase M41 n=1 Tax=Helianthus annuus TaxID=4232 RepID=A0A251RT64_HELAN|nr:putative peptidase M41 [Helianthus annuus]